MPQENHIQILTHIRRNRNLTPEQFYTHREHVHDSKVIPWAEKHGIVQYQQVHPRTPREHLASLTPSRSTAQVAWSPLQLPHLLLMQ